MNGVGDVPWFGFPGAINVHLCLVFLFGFVQAAGEEDLGGEVLLEAVEGGGQALVWSLRDVDEFETEADDGAQ